MNIILWVALGAVLSSRAEESQLHLAQQLYHQLTHRIQCASHLKVQEAAREDWLRQLPHRQLVNSHLLQLLKPEVRRLLDGSAFNSGRYLLVVGHDDQVRRDHLYAIVRLLNARREPLAFVHRADRDLVGVFTWPHEKSEALRDSAMGAGSGPARMVRLQQAYVERLWPVVERYRQRVLILNHGVHAPEFLNQVGRQTTVDLLRHAGPGTILCVSHAFLDFLRRHYPDVIDQSEVLDLDAPEPQAPPDASELVAQLKSLFPDLSLNEILAKLRTGP